MKLIFKAQVRGATGKTKHAIGTIVQERPIPVTPLPAPASVGIATERGGFFLLHLDARGSCFNDTWHQSLEEAKSQAQFEFEISENDWQAMDEQVDF